MAGIAVIVPSMHDLTGQGIPCLRAGQGGLAKHRWSGPCLQEGFTC